MTDPTGQCAEEDWTNKSAPCRLAYLSAMNTVGLDSERHKDLFTKFDTAQFGELDSWGASGIRLSEDAWDADTVWAIVKALKRIRDAVGGSQSTVSKMLGLNQGLPFKYAPSPPSTDPWDVRLFSGGGGSAVYSKGWGVNGLRQHVPTGGITVQPRKGSTLSNEAVIVHELGHRFDHIAGSPEEYWSTGWASSPSAWMTAAGWMVGCTVGPGATGYYLTDTSLEGSVSEYAAHGMYGVYAILASRYYQKHSNALAREGWTKADFISAATHPDGLARAGGNPAEDFAETFAWYVLGRDFVGAGGVGNRYNKSDSGAPNKARIVELEALLDQFR